MKRATVALAWGETIKPKKKKKGRKEGEKNEKFECNIDVINWSQLKLGRQSEQ